MNYYSLHSCRISPMRTLTQVPLSLKSLSPSLHRGDSWCWMGLFLRHAPDPLPFVPTHPFTTFSCCFSVADDSPKGNLLIEGGLGQWAKELCLDHSKRKRRDPINAAGWDKVSVYAEYQTQENLSTGTEEKRTPNGFAAQVQPLILHSLCTMDLASEQLQPREGLVC